MDPVPGGVRERASAGFRTASCDAAQLDRVVQMPPSTVLGALPCVEGGPVGTGKVVDLQRVSFINATIGNVLQRTRRIS